MVSSSPATSNTSGLSPSSSSLLLSTVPAHDGDVDARKVTDQAAAVRDFVLRESCVRADGARDSEELSALKAALAALRGGDAKACLGALTDRLAHLMRRRHFAVAGVESDDDDDDDDDDEGDDKDENGACVALSELQLEYEQPFTSVEFWRRAVNHQLTSVASLTDDDDNDDNNNIAGVSPTVVDDARAHLASSGWANVPAEAFDGITHTTEAQSVARAMDELFQRDLPPAFVFLFDEVWRIALRCWSLAESILEGECALEPTFAAYRLRTKAEEPEVQPSDTANAKAGGGRYLGTNFGGAHRDYTYAESFTASGKPRLVTVWVPLVDVGVDTGCMHVVPREFDVHYEGRALVVPAGASSKPGKLGLHEHRHVSTVGAFSGLSFLHFPLYGSRPLAPVEAGAALMWTGNLIHWGAPYHNRGRANKANAPTPRRSIGLVFRRKTSANDVGDDDEAAPITREQAHDMATSGDTHTTLLWRLRRIRQSLGAFTHWHDIPTEVKDIFERLGA